MRGVWAISLGLIWMMSLGSVAHSKELHFSTGAWEDQFRAGRLALRSDEINQWEMPSWLGSPKLFIEGSVNRIRVKGDKESGLTALGLSPVLQWRVLGDERPLYIEAGIGGALIDSVTAGPRELSTHYQFEDLLRLSWQFSDNSESRLFLMMAHYSNAGIKSPNMGVNLVQLGFTLSF
ncbi:acyloxyacyl hydrolase [Aliidiomarina sedimenti]|nr:acyloxyacyl hydrolase [Aliidiomarina sedimenti]